MNLWTTGDDDRAKRQGWALFSTDRSLSFESTVVDGAPYGHRPVELQKLDEEDVFEEDADAWKFVYQNFMRGDELATRAFLSLEQESPAELAAIFRTNHNHP